LKPLFDDFESVFGQLHSWKLFACEPADFVSVAGGEEFAACATAKKIDQHVMILDTLPRIPEDTVEHPEQLAGFDDQASFLASFANGGFADHLTDFEDPAGNGPVSLDGGVGAFHQYDAIAFDDDGTDTDQGVFGKFAVHAFSCKPRASSRRRIAQSGHGS